MSDEYLAIFLINGFTILIQCVCSMYYVTKEQTNEEIEYLRNKICRLEKHVLSLEQNIEELEEKVYKSLNANLTNSEIETFYEKRENQKQRKLEEFIDYYD